MDHFSGSSRLSAPVDFGLWSPGQLTGLADDEMRKMNTLLLHAFSGFSPDRLAKQKGPALAKPLGPRSSSVSAASRFCDGDPFFAQGTIFGVKTFDLHLL
jgi:hypothetical protein